MCRFEYGHCGAQHDYRPEIHRVIENRTCEHQSIKQRNRHTNRDLSRLRNMRWRPNRGRRGCHRHAERVGDHKRLTVHHKTDVAHESFVKNFVAVARS